MTRKFSAAMLAAACLAATTLATAAEEWWQACFEQAAQRYAVPASLLRAIAMTESAMNPAAVRDNGHSRDLGLMQINSRWLGQLKVTESDLLHNPCLNIHAGAWILAQAIQREGYSWRAVGAYHAGHRNDAVRETRRQRYARRVAHHLSALHNRRGE